jgi:UPF0755 protein
VSRGGSREPIDLDELQANFRDAPAEPAPEPREPSSGRGPGRGEIVPRAQRRRRPGRALLILLLVLAVPVALAGVGTAWFQHRLNGSPGGKAVSVTIAAHTSTDAIGSLLEHKGVIDSTVAFRLYTRVFHHSKLHAGTYTLHQHMGVRDAVTALERTVPVQRLVLEIRPGLWLDEIAVQVHDQLHLDPLKFISLVKSGAVRSAYQPAGTTSTEGLLYPDTYYFTPHSTELDVVRTMVQRFDEVANSIGLSHAAAALHVSPYDAIKVAALIQSEAKYSADGPPVASAIYNRLARNMPLQIDAMVLFANNTHSTKDFAHLRTVDSPYNSYLHAGLGPTPIEAATMDNLEAAAHPPHTTYIYWVNGDCAGHLAFATTQEQQNANVAAYDALVCQ